jgi:hypothetical protein
MLQLRPLKKRKKKVSLRKRRKSGVTVMERSFT